jgi:hypothetical protein
MVQLPVSRRWVGFKLPDGNDDLHLREDMRSERTLALELIDRLAISDPPLDWQVLTLTDFEALLLALYRHLFGNAIEANAKCANQSCGQQVEISFQIDSFIKHHRARDVRGLRPGSEPGWYAIAEGLEFCLPTVGDQLAVQAESDPVDALRRRCVRAVEPTRNDLGRAERAMAAMAPLLSGSVEGHCPHCGTVVEAYFDVPAFVVHELRTQAMLIYEDVALLASRFHWSEQHILSMPATRRQHYCELLRQDAAVI